MDATTDATADVTKTEAAARDGAPANRTRRGVATRVRLIEAGRVELAAAGYAGASLQQIAKRAGVQKPSVFAHFTSKDQLYVAVLRDSLAVIRCALVDAAANAPGIDSFTGAAVGALTANADAARVLVRELLDVRAPDVMVANALDDALRALMQRYPAVDAQLALSATGWQVLRALIGSDSASMPTQHLLDLVAPASAAKAPAKTAAASSVPSSSDRVVAT